MRWFEKTCARNVETAAGGSGWMCVSVSFTDLVMLLMGLPHKRASERPWNGGSVPRLTAAKIACVMRKALSVLQ